jgi:hypothetical protein
MLDNAGVTDSTTQLQIVRDRILASPISKLILVEYSPQRLVPLLFSSGHLLRGHSRA